MTEATEQLKRKVANLMREGVELESFRKDIDWLKTLRKKVDRSKFD